MCEIKGKYEGETFTGYKYAVKRDGKYYSWWTGVEYKVGDVEAVELPPTGHFEPLGTNLSYNKEMYGKTGVFKEIDSAKGLCPRLCLDDTVILKMKISGNLFEAEAIGEDAVIGSEILSIEEICQI